MGKKPPQPVTPGLTPAEARLLMIGRHQAIQWGKRWGFTGIYPETHRDGGRGEVARQRGALAR